MAVLESIYCVHLNCIHAMCNIVSLPTLETVSHNSAALPTKGQAMAPCASNYVTGHKKGCGFRAVFYLEVKIVLRGSIGSEQSVHYSELGGCPLLGGS